jgi:DNA invertase Pin-like site-specific DNA recombinase
LTPDQANAIRRRSKQGERVEKLASDYGVSRETIRNVLNEKTYRDAK